MIRLFTMYRVGNYGEGEEDYERGGLVERLGEGMRKRGAFIIGRVGVRVRKRNKGIKVASIFFSP